MFDDSVMIKMMGPPERPGDVEVYPMLSSEFESVSAKHLFVAGAAAHGMDRYKYKGSGGFIHGFRFNCQTLWRLLEKRYESEEHERSQPIVVDGTTRFDWQFAKTMEPLPFRSSIIADVARRMPLLWEKLIRRIDEAAGPYEMVGGSLADGIVYDCKGQTAWYVEDVPEDLIHDWYSDHPRFTWSFHYGLFHPMHPQAHFCGIRTLGAGIFSNFIHPVLQYYPPGPIKKLMLEDGPPWGSGSTFSEVKHQKYMYLKREELLDDMEHPSAVWAEFDGVKRMHIREAYILSDWDDASIRRQLVFFMSHVEHAAAQFCKGEGGGDVKQEFDERIDVLMSHPEFKQAKINPAIQEWCNPAFEKE
eukprot:gnl/MRDRNA2_/MRDRNA2_30729_c0_seq2.p1 gnl/MRDRNA2_/MRDRNA2_30729_c0~~gnl/MRDRNA2_/MRDRNA2_30729_c0_seq2.p1  ORF type:complete len:373 (-),score=68.08 gnl/MRDRNA2_/MRDRNA2_30729_c0_seq2:115-1194(-)